jgi:hypothetical protein
MKSKALALTWTDTFFNGDVASNSKAFDGLRKRIGTPQTVVAGANGAALDISMLDELLDAVQGQPDVLFCSKAMRRKIKAVLQAHNAYMESSLDAFGRPVMSYGGVPIRVIETNTTGAEILDFNETMGTDAATGSIFAVKFGAEQYVSGLQNGGMNVRDLGELNEKPVYRTRIEWYNGLAVFHPKACARLKGIKK